MDIFKSKNRQVGYIKYVEYVGLHVSHLKKIVLKLFEGLNFFFFFSNMGNSQNLIV